MSTPFSRRPLSALDPRLVTPDVSAVEVTQHGTPTALPSADANAQDAARHSIASTLTREEWLDLHVSRAPKITVEQWERSLTLLGGSRQGTAERAA